MDPLLRSDEGRETPTLFGHLSHWICFLSRVRGRRHLYCLVTSITGSVSFLRWGDAETYTVWWTQSLDLFPFSGEGTESPILFGHLNQWICFLSQVRGRRHLHGLVTSITGSVSFFSGEGTETPTLFGHLSHWICFFLRWGDGDTYTVWSPQSLDLFLSQVRGLRDLHGLVTSITGSVSFLRWGDGDTYTVWSPQSLYLFPFSDDGTQRPALFNHLNH
jgi:hypothetical protein